MVDVHIIVERKRRIPLKDINQELQWIGTSLGLFNERDKDKSCFRIFIELLKTAKKQDGLSSDELAFKLHLTRGTIIHHINKLRDAGIVISEREGYSLRAESLPDVIDQIEQDLQEALATIRDVAKNVERKL